MAAAKKKPAKGKKAKKKPGPAKAAAEMGRPTKYDPDVHPLMGWMLAIRGKTNKEIAAGLRISTGTLFSWTKLHEDFLSAIKSGKDVADAGVEQALYKRALGYDYDFTETTHDPEKGDTIKNGKKHVAGDVTAQIFWLCNRRKEDWKNVNKLEHSGPNGAPIQVLNPKQMTDAEIISLIRKERDLK
jgi:hypothetical protein